MDGNTSPAGSELAYFLLINPAFSLSKTRFFELLKMWINIAKYGKINIFCPLSCPPKVLFLFGISFVPSLYLGDK
jgi:hypothetical protein